jgi:hypothetical protein
MVISRAAVAAAGTAVRATVSSYHPDSILYPADQVPE